MSKDSSMDSPIIERQKVEHGYYLAHMHVLEATLNMLKMFMIISIVIAMVSLLISMKTKGSQN